MIRDTATAKRYLFWIKNFPRNSLAIKLRKFTVVFWLSKPLFISFWKCSKLGIPQHLGFDPDGGCPDFNRQCIQWYPNFPNSTMQRHCNESVPCSSCWDVRKINKNKELTNYSFEWYSLEEPETRISYHIFCF